MRAAQTPFLVQGSPRDRPDAERIAQAPTGATLHQLEHRLQMSRDTIPLPFAASPGGASLAKLQRRPSQQDPQMIMCLDPPLLPGASQSLTASGTTRQHHRGRPPIPATRKRRAPAPHAATDGVARICTHPRAAIAARRLAVCCVATVFSRRRLPASLVRPDVVLGVLPDRPGPAAHGQRAQKAASSRQIAWSSFGLPTTKRLRASPRPRPRLRPRALALRLLGGARPCTLLSPRAAMPMTAVSSASPQTFCRASHSPSC